MAGRLVLEDQRRAPGGREVQMSFEELGASLADVTFVVVDLETTGHRPGDEEITEIGAVKSRGGHIIGEFATLVNPNQPIPPSITRLTGITTAMTLDAPRIAEILPSFLEFVGPGPDTVLVAHNARFDVSHLKAAATGAGMDFPTPHILDTVALARRVITKDETPNYRLGTLAQLVGTKVSPNHRALDDAKATEELLQFLLGRLGPLGVTHLEDLATVTDPVPYRRRTRAHLADGLPTGPGVYRFIGPGQEVLYVGTSMNVYRRVRQYFTAAEKRRRMGDMVDVATRVEATACATDIEARIHELRDIARFDPPYNRRSKRPERKPYLCLTDEAHPRLTVVAAPGTRLGLGPFSSTAAAKRAKALLERVTQVRTCTKVLPLRPPASASACPRKDMGVCSAPCVTGDRQPALTPLSHALSGDLSATVKSAIVRLERFASREEFERAAEERDMLHSLISTAQRSEKIRTLTGIDTLIAARKNGTAWALVRVDRGALVASALSDQAGVLPTAEMLAALPEPELTPSGEETVLLYDWCLGAGSRLLMGPDSGVSLSRQSPAQHRP